MLKFKRENLDAVFYVHGSHHDSHEGGLDNIQVTHADEVRNVLQTSPECASDLSGMCFRPLRNVLQTSSECASDLFGMCFRPLRNVLQTSSECASDLSGMWDDCLCRVWVGLGRPYFGASLKRTSGRRGNIPNRHCLLVRDGK
jgi:hypothetical protein